VIDRLPDNFAEAEPRLKSSDFHKGYSRPTVMPDAKPSISVGEEGLSLLAIRLSDSTAAGEIPALSGDGS